VRSVENACHTWAP